MKGSQIATFFIPFLPDNSMLCPVITLKVYEARTKPFRGKETQLTLATIKNHGVQLLDG